MPRTLQPQEKMVSADHADDGTGSGTGKSKFIMAIAQTVLIHPARAIKDRILTPMGAHLLPVKSTMWLVVANALFYTLYYVFISVVLLRDIVHWDASTTNYIVTVLSQISALLTDAMLKSLLTTVRPALAARPRGTRFSTWMAQRSLRWITAAQLASSNYLFNVWSDFRLATISVLPTIIHPRMHENG